MKQKILKLCEFLDSNAIKSGIIPISPRKRVSAILFHRLFEKEELKEPVGYPGEQITLDMFEKTIAHYVSEGWSFVKADDLLCPDTLPNRCTLLTFDDGYADNLKALPILELYKVPATFFISIGHVVERIPFWSDIVYEGCKRLNLNNQERDALLVYCRSARPNDVLRTLSDRFGPECLVLDEQAPNRPMTVTELQKMAEHPLIQIGNHGYHHTALGKLTQNDIAAELEKSQLCFKETLGFSPTSIAYPNGMISEIVAAESQALFSTAFTVRRHHIWPDERLDHMRLGRFVLDGQRPIPAQLRSIELSYSLAALPYRLLDRISAHR